MATKEQAMKPADAYDLPFRFARCRTLEFSVRDIEDVPEEVTAQYAMGAEIAINDSQTHVRIILTVNVSLNTEGQPKVAHYKGSYEFAVDGLGELVEQLPEIRLPYKFLYTITLMVISTARGILIERSRGTILEARIMPPVNVREMLGEPDEEGFATLVLPSGQKGEE